MRSNSFFLQALEKRSLLLPERSAATTPSSFYQSRIGQLKSGLLDLCPFWSA
jgi:hypothetical protein